MIPFVGYKVNGILGAVVATIGVVLPSLVLVTIIATLFYSFRKNRAIQAILNGLKPSSNCFISGFNSKFN
ncbi:chromate transporter [bacterium]|nr:chromate transporter [bacterium]